jgi:hypothetical protein
MAQLTRPELVCNGSTAEIVPVGAEFSRRVHRPRFHQPQHRVSEVISIALVAWPWLMLLTEKWASACTIFMKRDNGVWRTTHSGKFRSRMEP